MSNEELKNGISGSTLKIIAIVSMLIDHIAASVIERYMESSVITSYPEWLEILDIIMRIIGRLAFPIYIFLLIEGYNYTRSRLKYLLRLCLFALISEIPFDIAFYMDSSDVKSGRVLQFGYQNVFFTLAIGLATIMLIDKIAYRFKEKFPGILVGAFITVLGMSLALFLRTDYSMSGVLAIVVAYVVHRYAHDNSRTLTSIVITLTVLSSTLEVFSLIDVMLIKAYNGKKGLNLKYVFYAFYPVHLLILGLICVLLGI